MRFFDIRLRYWAFRQFLLDRAQDPKDSEDAADFARSRRELLWTSVVRGHLDSRCFVSMDSDFPELDDPRVIGDDRTVLAIARRHLDRYLGIGLDRSGYLQGYLEAQRDHLAACPRCQRVICAAVREDVASTRKIRRLFDGIDPDAKRRIVEEFVPARARRPGDTTLN